MPHLEYFYTPPEHISGNELTISGQEYRHIVHVLRKRNGDTIFVIDGCGSVYMALITAIDNKHIVASIQKKSRFHHEPMLQVTLATGVPKGGRYDWIIEKGTELGVSAFVPLVTERSVRSGNEHKHERWKRLAIAAMKQSTRCVLPEITPPMTLDELIRNRPACDYQFIAHPAEGVKSLIQLIPERRRVVNSKPSIKSAMILIGPEGGFSPTELQFALSHQFQPFTLGERRLRTETAAILATGLVLELIATMNFG